MSKHPPHNRKALTFQAHQGRPWKGQYSRTLTVKQPGQGGAVTVMVDVPSGTYAPLSVYLTNVEIADLIAMLGKALVRNMELLK